MKRQLSTLLSLFILLALSACGRATPSPVPSPTATPKSSQLPDQDLVKALLVRVVDEEKRVPGIVVGMIAADPQERWVVGYGRLSAADERVPDGDTVFEIGSITKVFTGTLLAQAAVNVELQLDDPISLYLPEGVTAPEYDGRPITLLDLATHTSGLPRDAVGLNSTIDQMYAFLSRYSLTYTPGNTFLYSNFGFGLLGNLLVRRAGQEDYEALLVDRITHPLGMDSTRIELTPEMLSRLAIPHEEYSLATSSWNTPAFAGAGGIRSTANDMLKFLAANMGLTDTELQPALQLANTPQRSVNGMGYIGLGWGVPESGKGVHWHNGQTTGYHSFLAWDSERRIGVVVLANAAVDIDYVGRLLIRGLPMPFPVDPQVLAEYAGRYQLSDGTIVTIRIDGRRIFVQAPNQPEYELFAISEKQFLPLAFEAEITFCRNDSGEVDRLVFVLNGVAAEAKKVP